MPKNSKPSKQAPPAFSPPARINSSIRGLDLVLGGGLLARRGYLIQGPPGSGKTVLASQYSFDVARTGGNCVFVTLLSESHATLLENLRSFTYYDESLVQAHVTFISGYAALMEHGLSGLAELLQNHLRENRAELLVIDSIDAVVEHGNAQHEVKRFLRDLATFCSLLNCTAIFVSTAVDSATLTAAESVTDGTLELARVRSELRNVRTLEVTKLRGSAVIEGRHVFEITPHGIAVHVRVEARYMTTPDATEPPSARIPFGVKKLDDMLRGGLVEGSSTALMGAPGAGKTVLGMQFLHEGARRGEASLYFGMFEPAPRFIAKAEGIGLALGRHVKSGTLEVIAQPSLEQSIDGLAEQLMESIARRQVKRLFIDGVDGFRAATAFPDRLTRFFAALVRELRRLGVTTLLSEEIDLFAPRIEASHRDISAIFDNVLLLRHVELRSQLYRLFSILKVRDSDYDSAMREFRITSKGLVLAESFDSAEAILSGYARTVTEAPLDISAPPARGKRPR